MGESDGAGVGDGCSVSDATSSIRSVSSAQVESGLGRVGSGGDDGGQGSRPLLNVMSKRNRLGDHWGRGVQRSMSCVGGCENRCGSRVGRGRVVGRGDQGSGPLLDEMHGGDARNVLGHDGSSGVDERRVVGSGHVVRVVLQRCGVGQGDLRRALFDEVSQSRIRVCRVDGRRRMDDAAGLL